MYGAPGASLPRREGSLTTGRACIRAVPPGPGCGQCERPERLRRVREPRRRLREARQAVRPGGEALESLRLQAPSTRPEGDPQGTEADRDGQPCDQGRGALERRRQARQGGRAVVLEVSRRVAGRRRQERPCARRGPPQTG